MDITRVLLFIIVASVVTIVILAKLYIELRDEHEITQGQQRKLIDKLQDELRVQTNANRELIELLQHKEQELPIGCVDGRWCNACEFSERIDVSTEVWGGRRYYETVSVCKKGKSCEHFVERKDYGD